MSTDTIPDIFEKPGVPYSTSADLYSTTTIGAALPPVETAAVVNPPMGGGAPSSDPLAITFSGTIATPPDLTIGVAITPINVAANFSGGPPPKVYSIFSGTLPPGLALNSSTGVVSGTPTTSQAASPVVFRGTDNAGNSANSNGVPFTVAAAGYAFVTSNYIYSAAGGTNVALPAMNLVAGNHIFVCLRHETSTVTWTVTDTAGNVYTALPEFVSAVGAVVTKWFYKLNAAGNAANVININFNPGRGFVWLTSFQFSKTAPVFDKQVGNTTNGAASLAAPALTTPGAGLVLAGRGCFNQQTATSFDQGLTISPVVPGPDNVLNYGSCAYKITTGALVAQVITETGNSSTARSLAVASFV